MKRQLLFSTLFAVLLMGTAGSMTANNDNNNNTELSGEEVSSTDVSVGVLAKVRSLIPSIGLTSLKAGATNPWSYAALIAAFGLYQVSKKYCPWFSCKKRCSKKSVDERPAS